MFFVPFWGKKPTGRIEEDQFSIKRRKRIAVSDIFLNFAFAILVEYGRCRCCSSCYIYNKV